MNIKILISSINNVLHNINEKYCKCCEMWKHRHTIKQYLKNFVAHSVHFPNNIYSYLKNKNRNITAVSHAMCKKFIDEWFYKK